MICVSMVLLAGTLLFGVKSGHAVIRNYCTKNIASCTGADKMPVPIADSNIDPATNNYGCPSEMPTYLGCTSNGVPCCGKYVPLTDAGSTPSCVPSRKAECNGSPNADKSYECLQPGSCSMHVGSTSEAPGGTGTTCTGEDEVCCIIDVCTSAAAPAAASTPRPPTEYALANPLGTTSIPVILGRIIRTFLGIVGAIALAVFVYGGVMWMTARGDQGQVKKGQDALKSAVIGLFIIMFSYALTGNFIKFWTAEERDIAAQEGRSMDEEPATQAGNDLATIRSEAAGEQGEAEAGQAAAEEAGVEAGVAPTPASQCDNPMMTPAQKQECLEGSVGTEWLEGQSTVNNDEPSGFGQPNACQPGDPNCSNVGWKTVCNQTIFDTGYGTYNDLQCLPYADCNPSTVVSSDCSALSAALNLALGTQFVNYGCVSIPGVSGFGLNCGSGGACCKPN